MTFIGQRPDIQPVAVEVEGEDPAPVRRKLYGTHEGHLKTDEARANRRAKARRSEANRSAEQERAKSDRHRVHGHPMPAPGARKRLASRLAVKGNRAARGKNR